MKQEAYWEPAVPPEGTLRVKYNGDGAITLLDYRDWPVRLKQGDTLIVKQQTWDNLNDRELPGWRPGRWEKVDG